MLRYDAARRMIMPPPFTPHADDCRRLICRALRFFYAIRLMPASYALIVAAYAAIDTLQRAAIFCHCAMLICFFAFATDA